MQVSQRSTAEPVTVSLYAIYDNEDGRIVHLHRIVIYPGGRTVDTDEGAQRALRLAAKRGYTQSKFMVLKIEDKNFSPYKLYSVDLDSKRLREIKKTLRKTNEKTGL
jgi:hypothetical protein